MTTRNIIPRLGWILVFLVTITACNNPMLGTIRSVVKDYSTPKVSVYPKDGSGIAQDTTIVLTFTESIDTNTLVLDGTLATESDGGFWSSTAGKTNDTLMISPLAQWTLGSGRILSVDCADLEGNAIVPLTLTYGVLDGVVYVRASDGSDNNPGTDDLPKATVQAAVDTAEAVYTTAEVHVAEGTYNVVLDIIVSKDISLYGGYSESDWSARDPVAQLSFLNRVSSGTNVLLFFGDAVTNTAVVDGFTLKGGGGTASSVVYCFGGSPRIQNNLIQLGGADSTYGIALEDSSAIVQGNSILSDVADTATLIACENSIPLISGNTIQGTSASSLTGISNVNSDSIILANSISVGLCTEQGIGIYNSASDAVIRNNVIDGGQSPDSTGVWNQGSSPLIQNNIINGGDGFGGGAYATAIFNFLSSSPTIENNLIYTESGVTRTGVWQVGTGDLPAKFNNNDLFECPGGKYYDQPSNDAYDSSAALLETFLTGEGVPAAGNLFDVDPVISGTGSFTAGSPVSVTEGGFDLSVDFSTDKTGVARTAPWSIGAYEKD